MTCSTGAERRRNPFNEAQQAILLDFSRFELTDLVDKSSKLQRKVGMHNFHPVYRVYATSGAWFEYVNGMDFEIRRSGWTR